MTRKELQVRKVHEAVVAQDPAFKRQPPHVAYYWRAFIASHAYEFELSNTATFKVTPRDRKVFPELVGVESVVIFQDDRGKVFAA